MDFILKFRSVYQRVGNCYVGDTRNVIEMLYSLKCSINGQRIQNTNTNTKTVKEYSVNVEDNAY